MNNILSQTIEEIKQAVSNNDTDQILKLSKQLQMLLESECDYVC
jgi:hypothetical protein